jgi:hypothetical protein
MALLRDLSLTLAPAPVFGKMPDSWFLWKMPAGIRPDTGPRPPGCQRGWVM